MASIEINYEKYPGKSVSQIAEIIGKNENLLAVIGYISAYNVSESDKYDHFGLCYYDNEISAYLVSPHCKKPKVLYASDDLKSRYSINDIENAAFRYRMENNLD